MTDRQYEDEGGEGVTRHKPITGEYLTYKLYSNIIQTVYKLLEESLYFKGEKDSQAT